ncbi:MAG: hypothetical protein OHK0019_00860 [Saprospiraceae bacterium]
MPCDYKKYPPNWKTEIRPRILERAGHACELCGAKNGSYGYRGKTGEWWDSETIEEILETTGCDPFGTGQPLDHCFDKHDNPTKPTKIVLTIAHWDDPDQMNCDPENLKAACQYCHIRHDAKQHAHNARLTRERKAGLQRMF